MLDKSLIKFWQSGKLCGRKRCGVVKMMRRNEERSNNRTNQIWFIQNNYFIHLVFGLGAPLSFLIPLGKLVFWLHISGFKMKMLTTDTDTKTLTRTYAHIHFFTLLISAEWLPVSAGTKYKYWASICIDWEN